MTNETKNDVLKMGKGWFILKLAEEHGVNTKYQAYYGKESAMQARLTRYEKTKNYHKEILAHLVENWSVRISAGEPAVPNSILHKYAIKTLSLL